MANLKQAWSSRIKKLERSGWTLTAIGSAVGLTVASVYDLKTGRTDEPKGYAAVRLYLLDGTNPPERIARRG